MSPGRFFASLTTKAHRAQLCQLSKRQISANKTFFPGKKKKRTATFPDRYVPETLEVFRHRLGPFRNNGRLSSPAGQKAGRDAKRSGGKIVTCVGGCVFMVDLLRIDGGRKAAVPQLIIYSLK
jgi:hypothetical protein